MSSEHSKSKSSDKGPPFSQKNDLEDTFKAYIKNFNPEVPESEDGFMDGRVWRHFVTNLDLEFGPERVSIGCEVFNTYHGAHVGRVETMNFEEFYKAIDDLLQRNENYCRARGETRLAPSRDTIKAEIIKKPVTTKISAKWINKSVKHVKDVLFSKVTHEAVDATAITLRAMAESSTEALMQVGCSVQWLKPIIEVFKVVWKHAEAYRAIDGDIDEFASLLQYVSDAIVYIYNNGLYDVPSTKVRLEVGLKTILEECKKVLREVCDNRKNKCVKLITARNDKLKLKEQEQAILDWLNSLQVMQDAENQAITRENNELLKKLKEDIMKELHEIKAYCTVMTVELQKSQQLLVGKIDVLEREVNAGFLVEKERFDEIKEALELLQTMTETADDRKEEVIGDLRKRFDSLRQEQAAGFEKVGRDFAEHKDKLDRHMAEYAEDKAKYADRISKLENQTIGKPIHPYEHVGQEVLDTSTGISQTSDRSSLPEEADYGRQDEEGQESMTKFPLSKDYEKDDRLGGGSYGQVYKWRHRAKKNLIAVKEIAFEITGTTKEEEDIIEEIRKLESFKHEHIVMYLFHELNDKNNIYYIAMEYMAGGSLKQLMRKKKAKLQEDKVISYTRQILLGVQFLHEQPRPIVHRDIKSANILLNETEKIVKLADFGIAKELNTYRMKRGLTSERKGTYAYMAPEALTVGDDKDMGYGTKADIWGVGCVVLEMASGKPPWSNISRELDLIDCIREKKETPHVPEDLFGSAKDFLSQTFTWNADERPTAQTLLSHPMLSVQQGELDKDFGQNLTGGDVPKPILELNDIDILSQPENVEDEKAFLLKPAAVPANDADGDENVVKCKTVGNPNDVPSRSSKVTVANSKRPVQLDFEMKRMRHTSV